MNYGLGNDIIPYKGRSIDLNSPVEVYRNLNCKGVNYSLRQKGFVVAHSTCLMLHDVEFKVSQKGRDRARITKIRNVHAFIKGKISLNGNCGTTAKICEERNEHLPAIIKYNPFKYDGFTCENLTIQPKIYKGARCIVLNKHGVSAAYTY